MEFTCTQENLLQGLSQVVPVAGRNTQLPVLQHVLLQAKNSVLHLTTTDLEVGVHTTVGGKVGGEGSFTVLARSFLEYIQQLPTANPIHLHKEAGGMSVSTEGFRAQFTTADADDFPLLPVGGKKAVIEINAPVFTRALGRTIFAAAREETRPEIRSVFIHGGEGKLHIAATDSFRLAEEIIPLEGDQALSLLLPLSSGQEVVRLFGNQDSITITPQENHVLFTGGGVELSSRLIDGHYPDYQQIIPQTWKTRLILPTEELIRALKTLMVFLPRDSRRVQLDIKPKTGTMTARVSGSEAGQGDVQLEGEIEGEATQVLVNIQYLVEGLQHINSKDCEMALQGVQDPITFHPVQADRQYVYVVMPIQAQ